MKVFGKIAGINLGILVLYSLVVRAMFWGDDMGVMGASAFIVGAHVFACLVLSFRKFSDGQRELGRAWLGTSAVVLLIGFSVCLGVPGFQDRG